MSPGRSRRAGCAERRHSGGNTGPRGSGRRRTSAIRSRLVVARIRTFTLTGAEPPSAVDLAFLQCAQQLGLQAHVHFADFVQQQGAAAGGLELANTAGEGAGEGALLVTEQFRLQQVLRDRGAIQCNERAGGRGASGGGCDEPAPLCRCRTRRRSGPRLPTGRPVRRGGPRPAWRDRVGDQRVRCRRRPLPGWRRSGRDRAAAAGIRARRRGLRAPRHPGSCRCRRRRRARQCARRPVARTRAPMSCATSHSTRSTRASARRRVDRRRLDRRPGPGWRRVPWRSALPGRARRRESR